MVLLYYLTEEYHLTYTLVAVGQKASGAYEAEWERNQGNLSAPGRRDVVGYHRCECRPYSV